MADFDLELDSYFALDDGHFQSDLDGSVTSIDDKSLEPCRSDVQISSNLDMAEKLSDRQVQEAMNKLLKVGIIVAFPLIE